VLEGLDALVPSFVEDTNPATLDKALEFSILYAENCNRAGSPEHASSIASSLVNKNALSSRPSSLKLALALSLKLMEVGSDGTSSLHAIVEVFLDKGLSAKKPKVVLASSSLIHDAMLEFGAVYLPLASLTTTLPKMLSHANAKVRERGVQIVAELCRVLGSKSAIQDVIDSMKKAQVSQLDSLLTEQPLPSEARTTRRAALQTCTVFHVAQLHPAYH